jgi:hypothetical protein
MSLLFVGPYTQLTAPVRRGFGTPFCQRQTGRWGPTSGWTFDQEFKCLGPNALANIQAMANQYGGAGIEYEFTVQNGMVSLRTMDTTGNETIDVWEISASRASTSIFNNPIVQANVSANDLKVLAYAFQKGITPATAVSEMNSAAPPPSSPYTEPNVTTSSATQRLYDDVFNGADRETYYVDQYSIRHTTNASNRGYWNVADTNVNCIYTVAQFFSEITNGSLWFFPAPNEIIGALNVIFNNIGSPSTNYIKGALKGGSSRITAARNRVNIVTDYSLGNISTDRYALKV